MFQYTPNGIKFKIFVKETNNEKGCENFSKNHKYFPVSPLTGDKAKKFYEEILKDSTLPKEKKSLKPKPKVKPYVKPIGGQIFKSTDLLLLAQNNDVKNLKKFLTQKEYDINIVDDFGWTPLMCASCSGAEEVIEILLKNGADLHRCDKLGNTAMKLARQKNHVKIMNILENFERQKKSVEVEENSKDPVEEFFCPICKENIVMNKTKHESSTLHLFNSRLKTTTFYGIPECNKGFQLLLREGWDKEKGLGPDGTGRKFPVKAVMKKDRLGIGAPPQPVKNTIKHTEKYESKKRQRFKKWKEKDFEKNFRLEFS